MSKPDDFLRMLRRGPVTHTEAARQLGPYALGAHKRFLAAHGHIIRTTHKTDGTVYELAKDGDKDRLWEGGEAAA